MRYKLDDIKIQSFITHLSKEKIEDLQGRGNPYTYSSTLDHDPHCGDVGMSDISCGDVCYLSVDVC